jgi:hypothetical protein
MNKFEDTEVEHEYVLRDITTHASTDPKGTVIGTSVQILSAKLAQELNYARALNGNPHRLVKLDYVGY